MPDAVRKPMPEECCVLFRIAEIWQLLPDCLRLTTAELIEAERLATELERVVEGEQ